MVDYYHAVRGMHVPSLFAWDCFFGGWMRVAALYTNAEFAEFAEFDGLS